MTPLKYCVLHSLDSLASWLTFFSGLGRKLDSAPLCVESWGTGVHAWWMRAAFRRQGRRGSFSSARGHGTEGERKGPGKVGPRLTASQRHLSWPGCSFLERGGGREEGGSLASQPRFPGCCWLHGALQGLSLFLNQA